jgi:hypothetical protein
MKITKIYFSFYLFELNVFVALSDKNARFLRSINAISAWHPSDGFSVAKCCKYFPNAHQLYSSQNLLTYTGVHRIALAYTGLC